MQCDKCDNTGLVKGAYGHLTFCDCEIGKALEQETPTVSARG